MSHSPRHAIERAARSLPRWARAGIIAAAASGSVAGLAIAAVPSGAATGSHVSSRGQAGYAVTGARIQTVQARVYLRQPGQYASTNSGVGGSVSLWASDGSVVQFGISDSTNPASADYNPALAPFDSSHTQITTGITAKGSANFPVGEYVTMRLHYDRVSGLAIATATDATHSYQLTFDEGTGKSYTQARVTSDLGNTPWDSAGYTSAPGSAEPYLAWSGASLTSYSGHKAGFSSWWTSHRVSLVGGAGSEYPGSLAAGGTAFRTFLAP